MQPPLTSASALNEIFARHCGPTLAKLKPASLVTIPYNLFPDAYIKVLASYSELYVRTGIVFTAIYPRLNNVLVLVYSPPYLKRVLTKPVNKAYLRLDGYPVDENLDQMLQYMSARMRHSAGFPHETGIFLGYPLEDVLGFIKNKGQNYKLLGYWKVYSNEAAARQIFDVYKYCETTFMTKFYEGVPLININLHTA